MSPKGGKRGNAAGIGGKGASRGGPGTHKDLVGLEGLSSGEITELLDEAVGHKQSWERSPDPLEELSGKTVCLLFTEPSTRTLNAFSAAARRLSATVMSVSGKHSTSLAKGETLLDTALNLEAIGADVFVVRTSAAGAPERLAERVRACVVNGGDGAHEHPTQGLLDIFTLREHFGDVSGLHVGIVGDILHSRVARSNLFGLKALGARVSFIAPPAWMPREAEALGARVSLDLEEALPELDAVMALRIQRERLGDDMGPQWADYSRDYCLTEERLSRAKPGCAVLHPGPMNRGVEIADSVADGPRSLILRQVTNGVFVRMAVLARCVRAKLEASR